MENWHCSKCRMKNDLIALPPFGERSQLAISILNVNVPHWTILHSFQVTRYRVTPVWILRHFSKLETEIFSTRFSKGQMLRFEKENTCTFPSKWLPNMEINCLAFFSKHLLPWKCKYVLSHKKKWSNGHAR